MQTSPLYYLEILPEPDWMEIEPVFAEEQWLSKGMKNQILCPECKCVNRTRYPASFDIVLEKEPQGQTGILVELTNVTIWRKDFIDSFLEYLSSHILGKCYLPDGQVIEEYVTCYSNQYVVARGGKNSSYRICSLCGTIISNVKPGPSYILERYIYDKNICQDALCGLFICEDVLFPYDPDKWMSIVPGCISVRKEPVDGQVLPK